MPEHWSLAPPPFGQSGALRSALGVTSAAIQTWILGQLAVAYFEGGGQPLSQTMARQLAADARAAFDLNALRKERVAVALR